MPFEIGADGCTKFGETDHYLAATVATATWGYYDPNTIAKIILESGDGIYSHRHR